MTNFDPTMTLKLSIQRALLGEITDRFVAVTCGIENRILKIRAYVFGKCSEDDVERVQRIGAEVIADFPEGYKIEESCISIENQVPVILDFWAFKRAD
jgi:hypothetical protein